MKKLHFLLPLLLMAFASCRFVDSGPSEDELLQRELKSINWKEVDQFPSVSDCESIQDKEMRKQCFFDFLAQAIQQRLSSDTLSVLYPQLDTINVKVTVFPDSTVQFEPQFPADSTTYDVHRIDSILHGRLADFPKISPATKRGIPVKSQFILPVILKTE